MDQGWFLREATRNLKSSPSLGSVLGTDVRLFPAPPSIDGSAVAQARPDCRPDAPHNRISVDYPPGPMAVTRRWPVEKNSRTTGVGDSKLSNDCRETRRPASPCRARALSPEPQHAPR